MASNMWVLVEWVDEKNLMFPSYGVVKINSLAYDETDMCPGNLIFMRERKHENPRRAKILRISENKRYIREQRAFLEKEHQEVQNVLQLCVRTIKQMKSGNLKTNNSFADVVDAENDSSDSDSSSEGSVNLELSKSRSFRKYAPQYKRIVLPGNPTRVSLIANESRRPSTLRTSTPLPSSIPPAAPANIKLCFDQSTQTEEAPSPTYSVAEMEVVIKDLYVKFLRLTSRLSRPIYVSPNSSFSLSDSEENKEESYIEHNVDDSLIESNNIGGNGVQVNRITARIDEEDDAEAVMEVDAGQVKEEEQSRFNSPRVRKVSAQTTNITIEDDNDVDMVPIGNGHAKVPARVLNDIDWSAYTTATRQLLQAVFSRKVLATHSLTGKQSPAFLNKPPKKILDPLLIEDIVNTVMMKCGIARNYVRNCITIKCTDEAKLYRNRLLYKESRNPLQQIDENISPSTNTSDESMIC